MRLAITFLGLDLFSVELSTDPNLDDGTDPGDCTTYALDAGPTDHYMGFTLGLGASDE